MILHIYLVIILENKAVCRALECQDLNLKQDMAMVGIWRPILIFKPVSLSQLRYRHVNRLSSTDLYYGMAI